MLTLRHANVVACALANKLARIAWAVLTKHIPYDAARLQLADCFTVLPNQVLRLLGP